jgi:hypothetical protein
MCQIMACTMLTGRYGVCYQSNSPLTPVSEVMLQQTQVATVRPTRHASLTTGDRLLAQMDGALADDRRLGQSRYRRGQRGVAGSRLLPPGSIPAQGRSDRHG